ncbi:hypothetical protein ACW2QC_13890 [Virgibacillus sp. FSP13]
MVTRYLDYAEEQAEGKRSMYMKDWKERLDECEFFVMLEM